MLKKITCFIAACLIFVFSVSAEESLLVYGNDNSEIAKILGMTEGDLEKYCKDNGVTYLAVNSDNTKQIRKTETADSLSKEIFDLSLLEDKKIFVLSDELSGFENANGSIIRKDDLKFFKTEHETKDSGGEYVITQYVTIENAEKKVLTFYTAKDIDRNYIDSAFAELFRPKTNYTPFLTSGVAVFAVIGAVVLVLIIKDFKK